MESRETIHQTLQVRLDELDRQMDQIADRAAYASVDGEAHVRSQLSAFRTRLAEIRARLREKVEADDRADDAGLAELGRELNDMYAEMGSLPK